MERGWRLAGAIYIGGVQLDPRVKSHPEWLITLENDQIFTTYSFSRSIYRNT
jgi:hypothetical protein